MELNFLGRGSGFSDDHNSAFFCTEDKKMIIIDCPNSAFQKLKRMNLSSYEQVYVLITHTHGDHIGALGLFVQYVFFTLKKNVIIIAPSKAVAEDIGTILTIEGNVPSWYQLIEAEKVKNKGWLADCILTQHVPELDGKCFGYHLRINGKNVIYTGDTSILKPFLPYLTDDSALYVDTSVYYGQVHLKLEDALDDFISFTKRGIKVYLMHLDDIEAAEKMIRNISGIEVVKVYKEK